MQRTEAHVYYSDTIGQGEWFYGTTLQDIRYVVEGQGFLFGESTPDNALPATVYFHFPACQGGDVVEGYGQYNYIRGLAAKGVKTVARIEGLCASIAVLCAIACDTVEMADAALLMVHKPSSDGWSLTADDMRAGAELLDKIQAQLVGRYVARCGMSAETATELINKTSWLTADECMAYGFVTGKIPDTPIVAPADAAGVLNYYKPTNAMAITAAEKKSFFNELKEDLKAFFKNEAPAPEPAVEPVATNASAAVEGGDTMYFDGALAVDTAVYSDEAMTIAYPDGAYTADGQSVTVAAGIATSVTAAADAATEPAATNSAELEAANATIADLQSKLATANQTVTGLTNRLNKVVPGSAGNPTPPGAANPITNKTETEPPKSERAAERSVFLRSVK